ncbi:unnamed protein product [Didymodactylos carnosus]|nr:unnamed protein product [Didymodactylos carnosus]CAF4278464.1 unnamed protein product [Didymodactylos carnosus]
MIECLNELIENGELPNKYYGIAKELKSSIPRPEQFQVVPKKHLGPSLNLPRHPSSTTSFSKSEKSAMQAENLHQFAQHAEEPETPHPLYTYAPVIDSANHQMEEYHHPSMKLKKQSYQQNLQNRIQKIEPSHKEKKTRENAQEKAEEAAPSMNTEGIFFYMVKDNFQGETDTETTENETEHSE